MAPESPDYLGIDLGTTCSSAALYLNKEKRLIKFKTPSGNNTMPSVVTFDKDGAVVGEVALDITENNPENAIYASKRYIGRRYRDKNVQKMIPNFPYKVVEVNKQLKFQIKKPVKNQLDLKVTKRYSPERIAAEILKTLKEEAERDLNVTFVNATITVPASFNHNQRNATYEAAIKAGFTKVNLVSEPVAAAIAYGLEKDITKGTTVLVYDLGGGTFDVSIVRIKEKNFKVLSTAGNSNLGGEDFDNLMVQDLMQKFNKEFEFDMSQDKEAVSNLRKKCVIAKKVLSRIKETDVIVHSRFQKKDFQTKYSRKDFENLIAPLIESTKDQIIEAMQHANLNEHQIDNVILVGGSSRIPLVEQTLTNLFTKRKVYNLNDKDLAVTTGAAYYNLQFCNETPIDEKFQYFSTSDATALTLGIEELGQIMFPIIHRGTKIPVRKTEKLTTVENGQTAIKIKIFEGERKKTSDNQELGNFIINKIPKDKAAAQIIYVTFYINKNNILKVTAKVESNGTSKSLVVKKLHGEKLTKLQIAKIVDQADKHFDVDQLAKKVSFELQQLLALASNIKKFASVNKHKEKMQKKVAFPQWQMASNAAHRTINIINRKNRIADFKLEQIYALHDDLVAESRSVLKLMNTNIIETENENKADKSSSNSKSSSSKSFSSPALLSSPSPNALLSSSFPHFLQSSPTPSTIQSSPTTSNSQSSPTTSNIQSSQHLNSSTPFLQFSSQNLSSPHLQFSNDDSFFDIPVGFHFSPVPDSPNLEYSLNFIMDVN